MSIYFARPATLSIPDNDPAGVTDSVTVDGYGSLSSIDIAFRYTHTYPGDLIAYLISPNGTESQIWAGSGGTDVVEELVQITISDLAATFGGSEHNGAWTLRVVDTYAEDTGTVDGWQIEFFGVYSEFVGQVVASLAFDAGFSGIATARGSVNTSVQFDAAFEGNQDPFNYIQAGFGFSAELSANVSPAGAIDSSVDFSADLAGSVIDLWGGISSSLGFAVNVESFQDWLSTMPPAQLQEVYRLIVTGAADGTDDLVVGGISTWQATNQAEGRSSYLQASIPAAEGVVAEIESRQNGDLILQKGVKLADGTERYEDLMQSSFDTIRSDRGPRAFTLTISGYLSGKQSSNGGRTLTGIRSVSISNGKRRVRCNIDMFLQPGMTVTAGNETFQAGYINYNVSQNDKFCEVGER